MEGQVKTISDPVVPPSWAKCGGRMGLITSAGGEIGNSQTVKLCPRDTPASLGFSVTCVAKELYSMSSSFACYLPSRGGGWGVGKGVRRNVNATHQVEEVPPGMHPGSASHRP